MSRDHFDHPHTDDRREDSLFREPSTIAEFRVALAAEAAAVGVLRVERDAAVARADLAEARLAAIVEHMRQFSIAAHERYIACDVLKPVHLTLYGAANALDGAASDIRRIATDPKPNRMIVNRAAAVR